ncbi:DUF4440 domain-containing protein [Actinomycetota bacterium]
MVEQGSAGRRSRAATRQAGIDLDPVLALERELQGSECRADPGRVGELLDADFLEIGASGRIWDRAAVTEMLLEEGADAAAPIEMHDLAARPLTPDLVQVLWVSQRAGQRAARSSLWRRTDDTWRLVYHQGTPLTEG